MFWDACKIGFGVFAVAYLAIGLFCAIIFWHDLCVQRRIQRVSWWRFFLCLFSIVACAPVLIAFEAFFNSKLYRSLRCSSDRSTNRRG